MREIKFRGIPLEWNQFVYGGYIFYQERYFIYTEMYEKATHIGILSQVQVDSDTIGQYIGLNANSGKEIYEGDILQSFVDPEIKLKHVVEWSDKYLGWYLWNINDVNRIGDGSIQAFVYFKNTGKNCEIIGNIHENPEHLESIN